MEPSLRRASHTSVLLEIIWEAICRQPKNGKIPSDYVRRDKVDYRWVTDQRSDLDKHLRRLQKLGRIRIVTDSSRDKFIRLTQAGIATLVQQCLVRKSYPAVDGPSEISIISFDIPESRRQDRRSLRKLLNLARYKQVHKSTWVGSPRITAHLFYLIKQRGLESYVRMYSGREERFPNLSDRSIYGTE